MQVYRRRPSGLAPSDLTRATRRSPGRSAAALAALGGAAVSFGLIGTSLGLLWAVLGLGLAGSSLLFAAFSRDLALVRPCIVMTSATKWDGRVRTAWLVRAEDPVACSRRLAERLDAELGGSLVALIDSDGSPRGVTLSTALAQSELPVLVGWSVDSDHNPSLDASSPFGGIWLRVDVTESGGTASLLASEGRATDELCRIATLV